MTYRVSLNSIVENLERYCKHVDSLCTCYKAEQKKLEKDLQKMQGTYTDGYIQQTKKKKTELTQRLLRALFKGN